jgi:hypothetical protein
MDEQKKEESCSCESGGKCCCCKKMVMVLLLLLVGGIIGYLIGQCHGMRWHCKYGMMPPPMAAPATPTPPTK